MIPSIGKIIKNRRIELNITTTELATTIGSSQSAISLIENDRRMPNVETIKKLAVALELNESELKELVALRNNIAHKSTPADEYYKIIIDKMIKQNTENQSESKESSCNKSTNFKIHFNNNYETYVNIETLNTENKKPEIDSIINKYISNAIKELIEENQDTIIKKVEDKLFKRSMILQSAITRLHDSLDSNSENEKENALYITPE